MNILSITSSTFGLKNGNTQIAGTVTINAAGTFAVFTPSSPLSTETVYTVSLSSGVVDLEGQPLTTYTSSFTTGAQ